jgi:hypothetical protein
VLVSFILTCIFYWPSTLWIAIHVKFWKLSYGFSNAM